METELEKANSLLHISDQEFHELITFVYQRYGIDLSKKRHLIEGRLSYTLKRRNLTSFGAYMQLIRNDKNGDEIHAFLNKITTNHSYFARENDHFDFMLQTALPTLIKTRKNDLRIWSAGCSAGQEPYNIAMTLDQYFGPKKSAWDTTILATDISMDVLEKGKKGIYSPENLKGLPAAWRTQYFDKLPDETYQVKERIRKEVVYRAENLMDPFHPKRPFDIIFCRNVMIYFDAETTNRLVEKFYDATAPGGYLFIGHSESVNRDKTRYTYLRPAIYQKLPKGD